MASWGIRFVHDETAFLRALKTPVLVWETPPVEPEAPLLFATRAGEKPKRPKKGSPVFFFVQKSVKNAFAEEVTLGRTANNDISVVDNSVSRFHAYFAPGPKGWSLVDAKSTGGTELAGKKLEPKVPVRLESGMGLKVGEVELVFLEPPAFWKLLRKLIGEK